VRGAHLGPYCYPIAIDLLERGLVTSKGIVTHGYPLGAWDEAIRVANSLDSIKVLLKPSDQFA
jgi:L-iditol 2-dehydrogenase